MADLTSVGVTSGVPSSGTGTVATINQLTIVGAPISNGSTSAPVTVAITGSASAVTSTMSALVVTLSPNSSARTFTPSSNATVILSSNPTVIPSSAVQVTLTSNTVVLSSNPTITSISSGVVAIGAGGNTANVVAGSSAVTSTMSALVVALSTLGAQVTISTITSVTSGAFAIINGANTAAVKAAATAPSSTDPALVVAISPNSINPNGQAPSSNSAPVVISSNQTAVPTTVSSGTITLSSNPTVILSSNPTVIPSSAITIGSGSVTLVPAASGGLTVSSVIMSSGTNATLVSSSPRQVYKIECFNNSATIGYLHTYNLSSVPTVGSSLVFDRFLVPGNTTGAGLVTTSEQGVPYTTGLSYTFTGGLADSDTTVVAASAYIVNIYYK